MLKVSVLMLIYNHASYLRQALDSILMQEVNFDYEIVAGDDCSTDSSVEILEHYAKEYPNKLKIITHSSNVGIYKNLQDVFQSCTGQYIALLEGDDFWTSSSKLQQQIDFMDNNPDFSICFHRVNVFNNENNKTIYNLPWKNYKKVSTIDDLLQQNFIQTCSVVYRSGLINTIPEWFSNLKLADWPLHILHAEYGKIGYINKIMGSYRVHSKGVWSGNNLIYRNTEVIKMFETLDFHTKKKYNDTIEATITNLYFDNIRVSIDTKNWNDFSNCFEIFLSRSTNRNNTFIIKMIRIRLKYFLKKYFPFLHNIIKYLKNNILRLIIRLR